MPVFVAWPAPSANLESFSLFLLFFAQNLFVLAFRASFSPMIFMILIITEMAGEDLMGGVRRWPRD